MIDNHIHAVDLNLLGYLDVLLDERSVTRAAARAGLTQSAMSRALGKLRDLFDDPLLVRTGRGMERTARADALVPAVRSVITQIQTRVLAPVAFEPTTARAQWRIAASELTDCLLLDRVITRVRRQAPGVELRLVGPRPAFSGGLVAGRVDLVIGVASGGHTTVRSAALLRDDFACLMSRRHPLRRRRQELTLERYLDCAHVLVAPGDRPGGVVDDHLAAMGRQRTVAATVHSFLLAPFLVAGSDLLVTLPRLLASKLAQLHGLYLGEVPLELPPVTLSLLWHERWHHDPCHAWLRALLRDAAAELVAADG
ncbi:MAG: LysR family transcriptional regulator [Myxococcota bacterium]